MVPMESWARDGGRRPRSNRESQRRCPSLFMSNRLSKISRVDRCVGIQQRAPIAVIRHLSLAKGFHGKDLVHLFQRFGLEPEAVSLKQQKKVELGGAVRHFGGKVALVFF